MAALWNRTGHYIFIPSFLLSFFLFFRCVISAVSDLCLSYFHAYCGLSAKLGCRSETCCKRLAVNTGRKNIRKKLPSGHHEHHCTTLSGYIFITKACIDNNNNNNCFTALCPGLPRCAGTRRNSHSPTILIIQFYQILPSTTIHSILPVQITCLAVFLHNLSPSPLWSTSWSGALHLIFHTFLHPVSVFFRNTCPYHRNVFSVVSILYYQIPSLSLNSLLGTLSFTLTLHIHMTILISGR